MVSPMQVSPEPLDPTAAQLGSSRAPHRRRLYLAAAPTAAPPADEATASDDLRRLESSVQWLVRQGKMARRESEPDPRGEIRKLPRAMLLPPVPGIPPVHAEGSGRTADLSTFRLAPPLARERLQLPRRQPRHGLQGALCLLAAGVIAGSIAYHVSAGGAFSAWDPAHAAAFDRSDGGPGARWQNDR
jgi:hypothetical protein